MPTPFSVHFLFDDFNKIPDYEFYYSTKDLALDMGLDSKTIIAFSNSRDELKKLRRKRGTGYFWFKFWRLWFYGIIKTHTHEKVIIKGEIKSKDYVAIEYTLLKKNIIKWYKIDEIRSKETAEKLIKDLYLISEGYLDSLVEDLTKFSGRPN